MRKKSDEVNTKSFTTKIKTNSHTKLSLMAGEEGLSLPGMIEKLIDYAWNSPDFNYKDKAKEALGFADE